MAVRAARQKHTLMMHTLQMAEVWLHSQVRGSQQMKRAASLHTHLRDKVATHRGENLQMTRCVF